MGISVSKRFTDKQRRISYAINGNVMYQIRGQMICNFCKGKCVNFIESGEFSWLFPQKTDILILRISCYYGLEGQSSIDPEVFFKLMLIGYIENLCSDRKIIEHASIHRFTYQMRCKDLSYILKIITNREFKLFNKYFFETSYIILFIKH